MKILIVEDDFLLVEGLVGVLRMLGYEVEYVVMGIDVLVVCKVCFFFVIVLDLGLLDISGFDVFLKIECLCQGGVFIFIVFDGVDECVCGFDLGVDDYMIKLFVLVELEVCVCVLLCCVEVGEDICV